MLKVNQLSRVVFFSTIFKSKRIRLFMIMVVLWCVLFMAFAATASSGKYDYRVGQTAREDVVLQQDIVDEQATMRLRDKAEQAVEPVLSIDPMVQVSVRKAVRQFFEALYTYRLDFAEDEKILKQVVASTLRDNVFGLEAEQLQALAVMDQRRLEEMEELVTEVSGQIHSAGITSSELHQKKTDMEVFFNQMEDLSEDEIMLGAALVTGGMKVNQFVDDEATERVVQQERDRVDEVVIESGTIILRKDAVVTAEDLRILELAGLLYKRDITDYMATLGTMALSAMIVLGILGYMNTFHQELLDDTKKLSLMVSMFIVVFLISKPFALLSIYLAPAALFTILVGVAAGPALSFVLSALLVAMIVLWNGGSADVLISMLLGCGVAGVSVRHVNQRNNILLAGVWVGLAQAVLVAAMHAQAHVAFSEAVLNTSFALLGGLTSGILAIGLLPFCESIFHVLTPMRLLELSNPNHPLMKRLLMEAPGTYHHSILVGNLAEAAAHDVDANGLLARVGAFYHDIGKLERPYYFKENQMSGENPHDRLIPAVSASIIKRHSEHGLELGTGHKLPQEILDIIGQHHGTTLIRYFYHKACEDAGENAHIETSQFSYAGPVPQSKEAAIVMLADSVEAAVRSIADPTHNAVQEMVEKIVHQKMMDGQLQNCDLHFRDLDIVVQAFMRVLKGIFHERIEYPELSELELEVNVEERR